MRQYLDAKRQYRDAILFFRMGDFYEMFYEDALTAARALELTLTSRSKDASGGAHPDVRRPVPRRRRLHRAARQEGLPRRHLRAGRGPEEGQGRSSSARSSRVVSPGTLTDAGYLDAREPAFLLALAPEPRHRAGDRLRRRAARRLDRRVHGRRVRRRRRTPGARRRAGVLRPREIVVPPRGVDGDAALLPEIARLGIAGHAASTPGRSSVEAARRDAAAISCAPAASTASGSTAIPAAIVRRRRAGPLSARHAEGRPRARPRDRLSRSAPTACSSIRPRCKHLEILEGADGGRDGLAARRARSDA